MIQRNGRAACAPIILSGLSTEKALVFAASMTELGEVACSSSGTNVDIIRIKFCAVIYFLLSESAYSAVECFQAIEMSV